MLDAVSYQKNIIDARVTLTNYKIGVVGPREPATTKTTGFGVFTVRDDDNPVALIYQHHDLYIEGWRNRNQQIFLHKQSKYDMAATKKFRYANDYGDLGYDRNTAITLDLDKVNNALAEAYNAKVGDPDDNYKRTFVVLAIAFAEAVRFGDVMYKIIKGLPIDDLDWTKHKDKDAVLVVKG